MFLRKKLAKSKENQCFYANSLQQALFGDLAPMSSFHRYSKQCVWRDARLAARVIYRKCICAGHCYGLLCSTADVLALRQGPAGIVANMFVQVNGDVYILGYACERVGERSPSATVWRASTRLTFELLSRVAERCVWAPWGSDILVVRPVV